MEFYPDSRFVLVRSPGRLEPYFSLILGWRRTGSHWEAHVVYCDDGALGLVTKLAWRLVTDGIPVSVDPNYGHPRRGRRRHRRPAAADERGMLAGRLDEPHV